MPIGPSTSTAPYLVPLEPNVTIRSILTVGDPVPGNQVFAGIPDGIGAFDNGDGTFTVALNHEFRDTVGPVQDHGSIGAYIELLVIDATTCEVLGSSDAMQQVNLWDDVNDIYVAGMTAFNRFCSADLADTSAFFDATTGEGTEVRIYLTGEEAGLEGRAVATILTGDEAGNAFELPALGNISYENIVANPYAQDKTIVAMTDDATGGQVYLYVGDKQADGNAIKQAGLTNGAFYGIKVVGAAAEIDETAVSGDFVLQEIGPDGDVTDLTGADIEAESVLEGVTGFLRPEDCSWDPDNPNVLYFTTTNSFDGKSRLYRLTFADIAQPELGGQIEAVLDGSEGQHMFDNLTVANGHVILQEDPGGQDYVARVYDYDIVADTLTPIVSFDPDQFAPGAADFLTNDEESSGVLDVTDLLGTEGARSYLLDAQVHLDTGDPDTVEYGQLLVMDIADVVDGGKGDDIVNGDGTDNVLHGGKGDDIVRGGSGDDLLYGDKGDDVLEGWAGDDVLKGGKGDDTLFGDEGDDVLNGCRGDDELTGGVGADEFVFDKHAGEDTILDFDATKDTIVFVGRQGVKEQLIDDFDGDGTLDTRLLLTRGGSVTVLGVELDPFPIDGKGKHRDDDDDDHHGGKHGRDDDHGRDWGHGGDDYHDWGWSGGAHGHSFGPQITHEMIPDFMY